MIQYLDGDVFNVQTDFIAHQVNTLGVMGAGIALEIKRRFPNVFTEYVKKCNETTPDYLLIGTYQAVPVIGSNLVILNCFTQQGISRKFQSTNYDAITKVFREIEANVGAGKVITIPYKYGCGLAKGDWNVVDNIMKSIFAQSKVTLQIVKK